jgi:glycerol-3-phosphate dehydrogenase
MTADAQLSPSSNRERTATLQKLRGETFDLLVIGGGINGAAIARDAAMRGFRVALVEKGDFASGTSSKSSKLIHGGVRYLQQGDFRLVRVACRERDLLRRRLAPHLVRPLPFLFPVYRGDPVGVVTLGLGMWLYDLLAVFRNIRAHRMLTAKRTLSIEPRLRSEGLKGTALYYDCFTDDARLTLETILASRSEGAVVANYIELTEFIKENGRIVGAWIRDCLSGAAIEVRARRVVNATGPWADEVRRIDDASVLPCLRLTKGAHVIVPRERVDNAYAVVLRSPRDKRILFVIPWDAHAIIGTTDTDFDGSPDDVRPDESDVQYLLEAANWYFPQAHLRPADVISSYAGLRPLVASGDDKDPSQVSREEAIFESPSGLLTLAGGKLTTHRLVARQIVDSVAKKLDPLAPVGKNLCQTADKPLPGGMLQDLEEVVQQLLALDGGLKREQIEHLANRYGSRAPEVLALLHGHQERGQLLAPGMPDIWAEAVYAAQNELAIATDDILMRRTHLALKDPVKSAQVADKIRKPI